MDCFEKRREKVYDWMARENISLAMVEDFEHKRDPTVRWLTGQPGDALVFLSVERKCVLVPWDINMAQLYGHAEFIIPYNEFERQPVKATAHAAAFFKIPRGSRIEIPSVTAYPQFLKFVEELMDFDVICRDDGLAKETVMLRAIKDEDEMALYRKISGITNTLIDMLEKNVSSGKIKTESDAALFLEAETRKRGCEGTGFETLAAGPDRSFGIHCFPSYTAGDFAGPGLSILDFGVKYAGYTSDVTLTFARGPLSKIQEKQISLVEKAYSLALSMIKPGVAARDVSLAVDAFFAKSKKIMPHGLGHGIGLEPHEGPFLRSHAENDWVLQPGMIFTLEPGLYDPQHGGCRWENDIYLTETETLVLTNSRIIKL
ncbi:hypothetical protein AGMMS49928_10700 [Spirochaetia bacterium]|nr:hypothetical protein AGMMS49928_10700 [Spirochaetia bacterium]